MAGIRAGGHVLASEGWVLDTRPDPAPAPEPGPELTPVVEPAAAEVRKWAAAHGIDVPARGALAGELYDAYKAAHQGP